jgi:anti-sigma B factor antagonist
MSSPSSRRPAATRPAGRPSAAGPPLRATTAALGDGTRILRLSGEATPPGRGALHRTLRTVVRTRPPLLVVDLTRLGFCDSVVLNALLETRLEARTAGVRLVLAGPPPQTRRLLRLTGTDRVFTVCPTVAASLGPAAGPPVSGTVKPLRAARTTPGREPPRAAAPARRAWPRRQAARTRAARPEAARPEAVYPEAVRPEGERGQTS